MQYLENSPQEYHDNMDEHLPKIVLELHKLLSKTQGEISNHYLHLEDDTLEDVAGILVDFAADIHADTGIWNCYEQYNIEFFGTPLPLTLEHSPAKPLSGIHLERIRHLLWILHQALSNIQVLSPLDKDILRLADFQLPITLS